jgi:hypothetical protein
MVNYALHLGWPQVYKLHLVETVWPMYARSARAPLSAADRRSLWALLQQDEYITFRVLPLTRVTPKVDGSMTSNLCKTPPFESYVSFFL